MKRQTLFRALVVLAVVLLFAASLSLAQEGAAPASELSAPDAAVGTAFTYQGQLEDGAGPVNDSCDFEFALYDDATAGSQVGGTVAKTATVSDGLFSVALDFGADAFDGDARWLEIASCCPSTCSPVTLDPRQELTPAPYALYAPPSDVKQLIQDFVVASGESVTAGDVVTFLDGYVQKGFAVGAAGSDIIYGSEYMFTWDTYEISVAALSSTKFVVAYPGDSDNGTAMIGDIFGTAISYGSPYEFNSANTDEISVAALSDTKFVVAYQDGGTGRAVIGNASGTTISYGAPNVFNSASTYNISAAALSDAKFVVAYQDGGNSYYGTAVIGDVSGYTISYGSEYVFNSAETYYSSVAALSSTQFVVAYRGDNAYGTAVIGDVSDSTISYGSEYVFSSGNTLYISAAALSSTKFVVAYRDGDSPAYGTAVIGDVSDTTITYGSPYVFNAAITHNTSVAALSATRFVVAYKDSGNSDYGTAVIGKVSGNSIIYGPERVFKLATTDYGSVAALSTGKFVVAYQDVDYGQAGKAVIGEAVGGNMVGIARESKTAGQTVPVIIGGVSDVHSDPGLTPGEIYYSDISGVLTTDETRWRVGLAISATELLLGINIYVE